MFRDVLQAQFNRESAHGGIGINPVSTRYRIGIDAAGIPCSRRYCAGAREWNREKRKRGNESAGNARGKAKPAKQKAGSISASGCLLFSEFAGGA
ncbi:hypothetical protein ACKI2N_008585 [Cupriavidus sp. 30B13]|uniref:hypothetical protein n=1 Tax=Cupriavidus sp. 30B13 TaxID=3384241 RepID=UPI003B980D83